MRSIHGATEADGRTPRRTAYRRVDNRWYHRHCPYAASTGGLPADQPCERDLAQGLHALDAQAVDPLAVEVALPAPVDQERDAHRDERAEAGQRHVLLRVPLVAL